MVLLSEEKELYTYGYLFTTISFNMGLAEI